MHHPILAQGNALIRLESGVWVRADEADRTFIDYSDGDSAENSVFEQVSAAQDRSVFSPELDRAWEDWSLEYHLGSRRSNIYRGLNLDGVKTVLEVGCGCGAISRYLGERGFHVDAIEGTLRRAQIARLRTAELDNVQIISSNYHELKLPHGAYDLVVFTGVLEYSGAYAPEGISPEAQLRQTLELAGAALSEQGQILIAIENRTGFKYLAGAGEDHLNLSGIGLLDYREPLSQSLTRGIRTWSKREWRQLLQRFGFPVFRFAYPFPDYKVPDVILSDSFLQSARYPHQVLGGTRSRDYARTWWPDIDEPLFWKTAVQTASLDAYANSFLIVIGQSEAQLDETLDFDFVRFASGARKLDYRLQVSKQRDQAVIRRKPLGSREGSEGPVAHVLIDEEAFVDGELLEQRWFQALKVMPTYTELRQQLEAYWQWLQDLLAQGADEFVDALPSNIVVDSEGRWHLVDQEWHARETITPEMILFRALFNFVLGARDTLAEIEIHTAQTATGPIHAQEPLPLIETLEDFIHWGFEQLGLEFTAHRARCLGFEQGLQAQVSARPGSDIEAMLQVPIYQWHSGQSFEVPATRPEVRVFWSQLDGVWHIDHSVGAHTDFRDGLNLSLELPASLTTHPCLRIDLGLDMLQVFRGWLEFRALAIRVRRHDGEEQQLFSLEGPQALREQARLQGMRFVSGDRLLQLASEMSIYLGLQQLDWGEEVESVLLDLSIDLSANKPLAETRRLLREESVRTAQRTRLRQRMLRQQAQRLDENAHRLRKQEERLVQLREKLEHNATTLRGRLLAKLGLMRRYKV